MSSIGRINKLIQEEYDAVASYKEAIANCTDEKSLDVFSHILQEELEHIEELTELKEKLTEEVEVKDSAYDDVTYLVVVNGERYATFDNEYDAYQCESSFYNMDSDAEAYYGSYPDVEVVKIDKYGRRIKDSAVKKVKYGKPENYDELYYSVEGSEEGEIFDKLKSVSEARAKIRELKKSDKAYGIEQDYIVVRHYITEDSDYMEEL